MRNLPYNTQVSLCRRCGLYFKSVRAFDKHRTGIGMQRACRPVDELIADGWAQAANGRWSSGAFTWAGSSRP